MSFYRFKNRRGTATEWSLSNDVLLDGELGFETDTRKFKLGDGVTPWSDIDYFLDETDLDTAVASFILDVDSESRLALEELLSDGGSLPPDGNIGDVVVNTGPGAGVWAPPDVTQSELNAVNATATAAGAAAAAAQGTANTHASRHGTGGADEISISGAQVTSGTVADARIASTIARDSEVVAVQTDIDDHIADTANPHSVTKAQVGLGNADNTSDANKPISSATQTALNAKADLVGGLVPSGQLPAYVDDVVEAANFAALPGVGESGKIYVTLDNNLTYRWSGSAYVEISASLALGETSATAYRGDRGKTAYDHSQLISGNPHGVTKAEVGLSNVDNTSDADKPVSTAQQTALNLKANDADVVHDTGDETVAGVKTFSSAPAVPNDSFSIAKTNGLQAALDGKSATGHGHAASDITSGTVATARLGSGSAGSTNFLRGDQTYAVPKVLDETVTTDWNTAITTGPHRSAAGATNAPNSGGMGWHGDVVETTNGGAVQILVRSEETSIVPQMWFRAYWNDGETDGWNPWQKVSIGVGTDPFWAAKGDLAVGTANDVASVLTAGSNGKMLVTDSGESLGLKWVTQPVEIIVAMSDEATAITTGQKMSIHAPYAFTLTGVKTNLSTAGSTATVADLKENGTTVLSTKPSIDASEKTSLTGTAAVISDSAIAADAELTFHIDTAGTGAKGLKMTLIGTRL